MCKKTNSQSALEFIVLIAFMFLIFVAFIAVITTRVIEEKDNEKQGVAENLATLVKNEIDLAKSSANGYKRTFYIPIKIEGIVYSIEIIDNRELVINYIDKEYVSFLPEKVCGDIFKPSNEISKEEGITCVNSNLDFNQCQNAASFEGLCDQIDEELLPGAKCCCWFRYGLCGPP